VSVAAGRVVPARRELSRGSRVRRSGVRGRADAVSRLLERPLTSYHLVLVAASLLLALGLAEVLSASSAISYGQGAGSYSVFLRQVLWAVLALPVAAVATRVTPRLLRIISWPLLFLVIGMLLLTYTARFGVSVNGNRNWIDPTGRGGSSAVLLQPSEMAKPVLVLWGAGVIANKERLLHSWKHLLFPYLVGCGVLIALVVGQGDAGTALIFIAITIGMLFLVGVPRWFFGVGALASLAGVAALIAQRPTRLTRVTTFLDPFAHSTSSGYQAVQSIYALAGGGWWGVGLGASRQKWGQLPEANSDFIFAIIGEELGLVGALIVLALFTLLGYVGLRIAARADTLFIRLAAGGITVWLMAQVCVNIGAVLGLLPIAGVPLPLISAGGSSLLTTIAAVGALAGFARREPGARLFLRARAARRSRLARERAAERRREKLADAAAYDT
jgi:cell division protein FtsW